MLQTKAHCTVVVEVNKGTGYCCRKSTIVTWPNSSPSPIMLPYSPTTAPPFMLISTGCILSSFRAANAGSMRSLSSILPRPVSARRLSSLRKTRSSAASRFDSGHCATGICELFFRLWIGSAPSLPSAAAKPPQ